MLIRRADSGFIFTLQVLLWDGLSVEAGAEVQWQVTDAALSTASVRDPTHALRVLAQSALANRLLAHAHRSAAIHSAAAPPILQVFSK